MSVKIEHDYSYIRTPQRLKDLKICEDVIDKIAVNTKDEEAAIEFLDYIEGKYKLYQYKKDNGVRFGEHELFFRGGESYRYFTLNINHNFIDSATIIKELQSHPIFANEDTYIRFQYATIPIKPSIDKWLKQVNISPESVELFDWEAFQYIYGLAYYSNSHCLPQDMKYIIYNMEQKLFEFIEGKNIDITLTYQSVFIDPIQKSRGKIKKISDNIGYGFFKGGAVRKYYPITSVNIKSLSAV